nr:glycerate kinase [Chloroflexota bacterium]
RATPGAGAAGGVGYALLAIQDRFRSFALRPGVDLVMDATDFDARLARASLVITGEGRIDAQTAFGKTALGVARRAQAAGVPCIAVGGGVEVEGIEALATVGAVAVPVVERPQSMEEAMASGAPALERCAERIARLIDLTKSIA